MSKNKTYDRHVNIWLNGKCSFYPKLVEEHTFLISIQINNVTYNLDLQKFLGLTEGFRKKVTNALFPYIRESKAEEIMKS